MQHREERAAERQLRPRYGDAWRTHRREADVAPLTHRTGFCGCVGERVASRQHYLDAIERCEASIDKARHDTINGAIANSFFVIFDSQVLPLFDGARIGTAVCVGAQWQRACVVCTVRGDDRRAGGAALARRARVPHARGAGARQHQLARALAQQQRAPLAPPRRLCLVRAHHEHPHRRLRRRPHAGAPPLPCLATVRLSCGHAQPPD